MVACLGSATEIGIVQPASPTSVTCGNTKQAVMKSATIRSSGVAVGQKRLLWRLTFSETKAAAEEKMTGRSGAEFGRMRVIRSTASSTRYSVSEGGLPPSAAT